MRTARIAIVKLLLIAILCACSIWLLIKLAYSTLHLPSAGIAAIRFPPASLDDIRTLVRLLSGPTGAYSTATATQTPLDSVESHQQHPLAVLLVYSLALLIKQTFAIPGSALMNVLGGALYGHWVGLAIVSLLTAIGSSMCYLLSKHLGRELIEWLAGGRLQKLRSTVANQSAAGDLFYYMLSMRMFPLTPNWFLNIGSPHAGVPLSTFFTSMLLGMLPYTFITTGAGSLLNELQSVEQLLNWQTFSRLSLVAGVAFALPLLKRRLRVVNSISSDKSQ